MSLANKQLPPSGVYAATQEISDQRLVFIVYTVTPQVMVEIALVNGDNARIAVHDLPGNRELAFRVPLPDDANEMLPKARVVQMFAFLDITMHDVELELITFNINLQLHYWMTHI